MAALAPLVDSLNDDNDLPASDVVDFTPFNEVTIFEPNFKIWPHAIATRSVSLLKPPLHGDKFNDNTTAHSAVTVSGARQATTAPPHASHAVFWLGHQHYSHAYHHIRTHVRPSITLRPPADHDPFNRTAAPTPLVASLPTFKAALSHLDVIPHLGPTPQTSDVATWNRYPTPPLRGADTSDDTNTRPAVTFSGPIFSGLPQLVTTRATPYTALNADYILTQG
jgi:hypothetical protein